MTTTVRTTKPRHDVRRAWVSLILIPVFLVLADGVLHGLDSLVGAEGMDWQLPTLLQALVAGIPYALVMMLPGIGGVRFGRKALRDGDGRGRIPSVLGAVWVVIVIVGSTIFLVTWV